MGPSVSASTARRAPGLRYSGIRPGVSSGRSRHTPLHKGIVPNDPDRARGDSARVSAVVATHTPLQVKRPGWAERARGVRGLVALERPAGANGRGRSDAVPRTSACTDIAPLACTSESSTYSGAEAAEHRFRGPRDRHHLDGHQDATFFVGTPSRTHRPCARTTRPTGWLVFGQRIAYSVLR